MIEVSSFSLKYNNESVIDNLSFTVEKGQNAALVGSSGSGKSSILNIIMGFVYPFDGSVKVDGLEVNERNINAIRQKISWLPQELSFKFDSVKEMFYFPFTYKVNRALYPQKKVVRSVFGSLLLDYDLMDKRLSEISGGQKQRIALASIVLLQRPLILLDEPTSALDSESRLAMLQFIKSLENVTTLSSTHDCEWINGMDNVIKIGE